MENYITDISLAPRGHDKINWVKMYMPLLRDIEQEFTDTKPFEGINIALSIHLEAKTAYLCKVLAAGGANMGISGSNPLSTQDDVAAALVEDGLFVAAHHGATQQQYMEDLNHILDIEPDIIIDDGGDLVHLLHSERSSLQKRVIGGCEETTTGVLRLKAREKEGTLAFPMIAVNNAYCKYLFDNRYGTGQSVWDGIMRTTNLIVAGKNVVVAGYGWCGKGVANKAKGLGANVIVCEVDPIKAIEAVMDGFRVMTMDEAASIGDIFITVTGCKDVIRGEHFQLMKSGVLLANAGHFDVEINIPDLKAVAVEEKELRHNITGYRTADGRWINLLAQGRLVNLASGDGHPAEIMDMSFALQALSAQYLVGHKGQMDKRVYDVPAEIDQLVAKKKLASLGITIDSLSDEQRAYLESSE
ncbi:adenosylhomocysteinase [Mahella australiensis]|uniref:Adenosylhomocysteinase n=1 Tax=Mahella australiensis (strain DSM 15567 / CIP 107919 / 50-1 BON) TaxID=697281 RepID=F3ZXN6_MAHA5|nr:adenosylhomocysteinase [Mahella australiensis]AEE95543.1 adenosylhomocysteinase [Mahella australiensis 50-1 BON]